MPQDQTPKVSRWAHYKRIKAWRYVALSIAAIAFFAWLSIAKGDWAYLERSGGIIALLGALLGLRKLFRRGPATSIHPMSRLPKADSSMCRPCGKR